MNFNENKNEQSIFLPNNQVKSNITTNFIFSLEETENRFEMLKEFVKKHMLAGEDYGYIPGISKPSLLKPGAEKLCDVYGFSKLIDVTDKIEDFEKGFFHYEVKVTLVHKNNNIVEAEGIGSCNSKEKRYRYQDVYTMVNTILKMAKKRALIDAVLTATRSSGLFTQDIEDIEVDVAIEKETIKKFQDSEATEKQKKLIFNLAKEKNISNDLLQKMCYEITNKENSKDWTKEDASGIIKRINSYSEKSLENNKKDSFH